MNYDFGKVIEALPDRFRDDIKADFIATANKIIYSSAEADLVISEMEIPTRRMYLEMLNRAIAYNPLEREQIKAAVEKLRASLP